VLSKKRRHILVVVNVFRPDLGGGVLFTDLCEGLGERGFDVTVRCAYPYYPQWKDTSGQNGFRIRTEISDGIRVERFGLYIPSNPNSLFQRLLYEASFFLSLLRRLPRRGQFDAMLVISPLMGSVAYASVAAAWARVPWWLNVQDLSAQAAAAGGISKGSSILVSIQNFLFSRAPVWSSISAEMVEALEQIPGSPDEVLTVPNWLHESLGGFLAESAAKSAPAEGDPVRLFYSGNIGGKQNLLQWCQRLAETRHNFTLRIHGEGGRAKDVRDWIAAANDSRFEMHPLTDEAGLAQAFRNADFYVITEKADAGNSFVPSKLIPGMTSATPILAVCDHGGPLGKEVVEYEIGYQMSWDDSSGLDRLFETLRSNPQEYDRWSHNAVARSSFYDRERGIDRCVQVLNTLLETNQKKAGHG